MSSAGKRFATRAVHAGLDPDPHYRSIVPAIHQTSTFVQSAVGEVVEGYDYARAANPTRSALERALGELEGGTAAAFSSGLAATHALITAVCRAGDHIVLPNDLYGGTYRLVDKVLTGWGLRYDLVDQTDLDAVGAAVRDDTRLIWVETPTNPQLNVIDIEGVIARKRDALVAVDNTFATPVNQRPLELDHRARGGWDRLGRAALVHAARDRRGARPAGLLPRAPRAAHAAPADARARRVGRGGRGVPQRCGRRHGRALARLQRDGELPPPRRGGDRREH
jgi:hypothetical protein